MNNNMTIKTVTFGGFDRDSVLQYIDQLNQSAHNTEMELSNQIQSLNQSRQQLTNKMADFEQRIADLEQQLESERSSREKLIQENRSLEQELASIKMDRDKNTRVLALEQEKNKQLVSRMSNLEQHASKYDEACAQVGAALLDARQDAQRIVEKAQVQAEQMACDAKDTVESVYDGVASLRSDLDGIREHVRRMTADLETRLDALYRSVEEAAVKAECFRDEFQDIKSSQGGSDETSNDDRGDSIVALFH